MPKQKAKQSEPRITSAELDKELGRLMAENVDEMPTEGRARARWVREHTPDIVNDTLMAAVLAILQKGTSMYRISVESGVDNSLLARWLNGEKGGIQSTTASQLMEYLGLEIRPKADRK